MEIPNVFDIVATGAMAMIGYFVKGHNRRIEHMESSQEKNADQLNKHMLESEKRYAKEETLQTSLARIHDRLDKLPADIIKIVDRQNLHLKQ